MVGFDDMFHTMDSFIESAKSNAKSIAQIWPPYNVVKTGDRTYSIQMALAGFSKTDIELELDGSLLKVKGETKPSSEVEYLHKGSAERAFERKFTLADSVEIKNAELINGILEITLENQIKAIDAVKKIAVK
jgi:molecular chaperone IbpA